MAVPGIQVEAEASAPAHARGYGPVKLPFQRGSQKENQDRSTQHSVQSGPVVCIWPQRVQSRSFMAITICSAARSVSHDPNSQG